MCKSKGRDWSHKAAQSVISESIQMGQTLGVEELEKQLAEDPTIYPLNTMIGLAYLTVLKDCEAHCFNEGLEVKMLGGLHVIGTSLHESRRIDNQVTSYS